ncbi:MAG: Asp23/Gls24 family envelope stress response protein [Eubacteriales bacterium]
MKIDNKRGHIEITNDVFTAITGSAATSCYGVKGMALTSKVDGLVHLLKRESMAKGVKVTCHSDESISIQLHIIVEHGVNLVAVSNAIMSEVQYVVTNTTGVPVKKIEVFVDGIRF